MRISKPAITAVALFSAACTTTVGTAGDGSGGRPAAVPAAVAEIAAPNQDLTAARLRPEDGCYWYLHAGPVETTLIPLRTAQGNPICTEGHTTAGTGL